MSPELLTATILGAFFTLSFLGLGYSDGLSFILGGIGGLSGGLIVKWWQDNEVPVENEIKDEPQRKQYDPTHQVASSTKSLIKYAKRKLSKRRGSTLADWLVRPTKQPRK